MRPLRLVLLLVLVASAACRGAATEDRPRVVASFYPLAWLAERVGGSDVSVEDLTPPGVEAHDTKLTASQRADIQDAAVVIVLGEPGFQPDVEAAAEEARGRVIRVTDLVELRGSGGTVDPHFWLDPDLLAKLAVPLADALGSENRRALQVVEQLRGIARLGDETRGCPHREFVVSHEAFGYLADRYGLRELGIEGVVPESEPSAARIEAALQAIRSGEAAPAVFYEDTDEGRRIGESVAGDAGVLALPLNALESQPESGDYASVMTENFANLEKGLQCR